MWVCDGSNYNITKTHITSHHTSASNDMHLLSLLFQNSKKDSERNKPEHLINNNIDFLIFSHHYFWNSRHTKVISVSKIQLLQNRKEKLLQRDLMRNRSHHRTPRSDKKYLTNVWLPVPLWFIIPYLIPLITSTLHPTISQNKSDKRDILHFCCR